MYQKLLDKLREVAQKNVTVFYSKFERSAGVTQKIEPISDYNIDQFLIDGMRHDAYLTPENRNFDSKNRIVSEIEQLLKGFNKSASNRNKDEYEYLLANKAVIFWLYDYENFTNSQLRGHVVFFLNKISEHYFLISNKGLINALEIARTAPLTFNKKLVLYHSCLTSETKDSLKHANELVHARQINNITNKQIFVTGDKGLDDPEVQRFIAGREVIFPATLSQTNFDFLQVEVFNVKEVIVLCDSKSRSLNSLTTTNAYDKNNDSMEYWNVGSTNKEYDYQKMLRDKALKVLSDRNDPRIKDITQYKTVFAMYSVNTVVKATFNREGLSKTLSDSYENN